MNDQLVINLDYKRTAVIVQESACFRLEILSVIQPSESQMQSEIQLVSVFIGYPYFFTTDQVTSLPHG